MESDKQGLEDYVWDRLPIGKRLVGRQGIDAIVRSALHCPLISAEGAEGRAGDYLMEQARKDGSLGAIILSWILPYLIAEIVRLVARWLAERELTGPFPRVHG